MGTWSLYQKTSRIEEEAALELRQLYIPPGKLSHTPREVFDGVTDVLISTLAIDAEEVVGDALLTADLNAESIDFLDITFQLEKTFCIKCTMSEFFYLPPVWNESDYVSNGKLNEKGLAALKAARPYLDLSTFAQDPRVENFWKTHTVRGLMGFVLTKCVV